MIQLVAICSALLATRHIRFVHIRLFAANRLQRPAEEWGSASVWVVLVLPHKGSHHRSMCRS